MEGNTVFKHILFPTDGSPASVTAAEACIRFAAETGARVTALHVEQPIHLFTYEPQVTEHAHEEYRRLREQHARNCLDPVAELAWKAKVDCTTLAVDADEPYEGILATAHERMCDLIMMASHGHRGIRALLIGSQTQKVLTHSAIPVIVYR
jgi:nucleotide-binding universal stress UspA family protein